ncbi:MAG: hypothetical protein DMG37_23930, partial [Acidobacteria bacterium]
MKSRPSPNLPAVAPLSCVSLNSCRWTPTDTGPANSWSLPQRFTRASTRVGLSFKSLTNAVKQLANIASRMALPAKSG